MLRRLICTFCALLLLVPCLACPAESAPVNHSYDFDLLFSLNAGSFPPAQRARAQGYADLLDRLGLRGSVAWNTENRSFDLDATLYYIDRPSCSFPFHIYGGPSRWYITSPMLGDAEIFLNMSALLEFAIKAKDNLNIPLPYVAFLFPYTTEYAFSGLSTAWKETIGVSSGSRTVTAEQCSELSSRLSREMEENSHLNRWLTALADGSSASAMLWREFDGLPAYCEKIAGSAPITVTVDDSSETWKNSSGDTLFSRRDSGTDHSVSLSLPATDNNYVPAFSWSVSESGSGLSFILSATILRGEPDPSVSRSEEEYSGESSEDGEAEDGEVYEEEVFEERYDDEGEEYEERYGDEEEGYDDGEEIEAPDVLLKCVSAGKGLPASFPANADFTVDALIEGTVYPNYAFTLHGETKSDGSVSLSLCKPYTDTEDTVVIFNCFGTVLPGEAREVPDYLEKSLEGTYNVFSFNEQRVADFTKLVVPHMVRSLFSFVEEAPTAACQSFLDDLTDMGILPMILNSN